MAEPNLVHARSSEILLVSNIARQPSPDNAFRVGVIAATEFDTLLGVNLLKRAGIFGIACSISKTPTEQTKLQLKKYQLSRIVEHAIRVLMQEKISCIFIHCYSLSCASDLKHLRRKFTLPIITPLESYKTVAKKFNYHSIIAANCQSAACLEKILLTHDSTGRVYALGNLALVNAIEAGIKPKEIIASFKLVEQCNLFKSQGCQSLILGCTHFTYIHKELIRQLEKVDCKLTVNEYSTCSF